MISSNFSNFCEIYTEIIKVLLIKFSFPLLSINEMNICEKLFKLHYSSFRCKQSITLSLIAIYLIAL